MASGSDNPRLPQLSCGTNSGASSGRRWTPIQLQQQPSPCRWQRQRQAGAPPQIRQRLQPGRCPGPARLQSYTPQSARLRTTIWGTSHARVPPVARQSGAHGVAEELAELARAGSGRGILLNLDASSGQGEGGQRHGAGGVVLDRWPCRNPAATPAAALEVAHCSGSGSAGDRVRAANFAGDRHEACAGECAL